MARPVLKPRGSVWNARVRLPGGLLVLSPIAFRLCDRVIHSFLRTLYTSLIALNNPIH
jgi:hypothetical protein